MKTLCKKIYLYFETLPDRLYPFACEIEGRWVRGRQSYLRALEMAFEKYGPNHFGYKLTFYRATFHFVGAVIFVVLAAVVSKQLFGSETALYILVAAALGALFFQEFYSHPKRYGQLRRKGVADLLTWMVPMVLYLMFLSS